MTVAVDVVIVTHGGALDLPECIRGVRAQDDAVGRILLIDNASPDDTVAVARSLARSLDRLDVIANAQNVGYAAAMNQALTMTDTPFVLALNADCVLAPGYVAACVDALGHEPQAAAATGLLELPDGRVDSSGIALSRAAWASERDRHATPAAAVDRGQPFGVSGAAALWRRAALDSLGADPWWSWLFVYWDDVELCWRARRHGWTFLFAPEARATHRRGSDSANATFVEGQSFRNRLATVARHGGWMGLLAPPGLAATLVVATRLALRHRAALRAAHPIAAVRAGLAARRLDGPLAAIGIALEPHPWVSWLGSQAGRDRHAKP